MELTRDKPASASRFLFGLMLALCLFLGLILAGLAAYIDDAAERYQEQTDRALIDGVQGELAAAAYIINQLVAEGLADGQAAALTSHPASLGNAAADQLLHGLGSRLRNRHGYDASLFVLSGDQTLLVWPTQGAADQPIVDAINRSAPLVLDRHRQPETRPGQFAEIAAAATPRRTGTNSYLVPAADADPTQAITLLAELRMSPMAGSAGRQTLLWGVFAALGLIVWSIALVYGCIHRSLLRPLQQTVAAVEQGQPIRVSASAQKLWELDQLITHYNNLLAATRKRIDGLGRRATTDTMTGLSNRSRLEDEIAVEVHRAQRYGRSFAIVLLDLDNFKAVNDRFGHAAGDRVLATAGAVIKRNTRGSDSCARWGGEEFLVLCRDTGQAGAVALANTLRTALAACEIAEVGSCTASFGVASFRPDDDFSRLFARADTALYRAKADGRNRVCGEDSPDPEPEPGD